MKKMLSVVLAVLLFASCALPAAALEEYDAADAADTAPATEAGMPAEAEDADADVAAEPPAEESIPDPETETVSDTADDASNDGAALSEEDTGTEPPAKTEEDFAAIDAAPEDASLTEDVIVKTVTVTQTAAAGDDGLDNDTLFAYYMEDQMYPGLTLFSVWSDGVGLTGLDAVLYEKLSAEIKRVAAGERASTVFSFSLEELGLQVSWTWEELGLSPYDPGGLEDALGAAYSYDMDAIQDVLLSNFPYELYWYDKTNGTESSLSYGYSYNSSRVSVSGTLTVEMVVSRDYRTATYTVDTAKGAAVQTTVSTAKSIVAKYAGRSDWEKLDAYRQEICALTEYNHAAANDTATPYGNPWQLIWVFDGDPGTTVVCEGYAKAFQYLFDLSSFSGDLSCIMATGDMKTSGPLEPHMWNIVRMDDGFNYLVDITNCDTGSIGEADQLFLAGYSSGSLYGGYTYLCSSGTVSYTYDSSAFATYETSLLTMSPEKYTVPTQVPGDINGDNAVNAADVIRLLRYINGQSGVTVDETIADLNADGTVNLLDLLRLVKFVNGQIVTLL